jgi:RNase adaptor protein for sRNA GlmZ degradation
MIIWINGAFGSGKTQTAAELNRRIPNSFVYDPENLGFFISKNIPPSIRESDFQDCEMWRELNVPLIKYIKDKYDGVLIIPMTLVNPKYFNEIVVALRNQGVDVKHFTLMASKETLIRRLKSRGDGINSWPAKQIDRCINGLTNEIFKHHIDTENMFIEEVAEKIALMSDVTLIQDNSGKLRRKLRRTSSKLRHIRIFFRGFN